MKQPVAVLFISCFLLISSPLVRCNNDTEMSFNESSTQTYVMTASPSEASCSSKEDCGEHGYCQDQKCYCIQGYFGERCETKINCLRNSECSFHSCRDYNCFCPEDYIGTHCETKVDCRPDDEYSCRRNGDCLDYKCVCHPGYAGTYCQNEIHCYDDNGCNGHGTCTDGQCICDEEHTGDKCQFEYDCLRRVRTWGGNTYISECYRSGKCVDGKCVCYINYAGRHCERENPCYVFNYGYDEVGDYYAGNQLCYNHGKCIEYRCYCFPGYTGRQCETRDYTVYDCGANETSYEGCSGHGQCLDGVCSCFADYTGAYCETGNKESFCGEIGTSYEGCSDHGKCLDGQCSCNTGFTGVYCETASPILIAGVTVAVILLGCAVAVLCVRACKRGSKLASSSPADEAVANTNLETPHFEGLLTLPKAMNRVNPSDAVSVAEVDECVNPGEEDTPAVQPSL